MQYHSLNDTFGVCDTIALIKCLACSRMSDEEPSKTGYIPLLHPSILLPDIYQPPDIQC